MKIKISCIVCFLFVTSSIAQNTASYQADFKFLWDEIDKNYAYFDKKSTDWDAVKAHYAPLTDTISHPYYFTLFLEDVLLNLYDPHTHLRTSTPESVRLLSSGLDFWVSIHSNEFYISEVRKGATVAKQIKPGDKILAFNGVPIEQAIQKFIGKFVDAKDPAVQVHAVNILMGGDYKNPRHVTIQRSNTVLNLNLGISEFPSSNNTLLFYELREDNVGYIRIENSLGNLDLVEVFDTALDQLMNTKALILDLRNTSSGGDSQVAKPILGRFVSKLTPYQKHYQVASNKKWTETIAPRGESYKKKVYVLVNRWTGSMGEGFAIGMDSFGNTEVIGTKMTGLLGANYTVQLPNNGYKLNIVHEKLFHVNGMPREDFVPQHKPLLDNETRGKDAYIEKALQLMNE